MLGGGGQFLSLPLCSVIDWRLHEAAHPDSTASGGWGLTPLSAASALLKDPSVIPSWSAHHFPKIHSVWESGVTLCNQKQYQDYPGRWLWLPSCQACSKCSGLRHSRQRTGEDYLSSARDWPREEVLKIKTEIIWILISQSFFSRICVM